MLTRRTLLAAGGAATLAAAGPLLAGCTTQVGPAQNPAPTKEGFATPTFQAFTGVEATKPALPNGTGPFFARYPAAPPTATTGVPGAGGKLTCHTFLNTTPRPMVENRWWQQLNESLGCEIELAGAPIGDYPSRFQTVIAGGELPDLMAVLPDSTPELGRLLEAKFQDLTDFLAGDEVLKYPGLANLPSSVWSGCTYNGRIYTLPVHRFALMHGWVVRTDVAAQRDADVAPKSGQEFHEMLAALADRDRGWFATNNVVWLTQIVAEMMGVPNSWRAEAGSFVKDAEVPEYLEVLEFVRKCWSEDLIHPSAFDANFSLQTQALFSSGDVPLVLGGVAWSGNAAAAKLEDPAAESATFALPKWDGSGLAQRWVNSGAPYQTAVKQASKGRVEEILRIVNWMCSPWGTEEYMLSRSGIEGHNYNRDDQGSPIALKGPGTGEGENMSPLLYIGSAPQVHFSATFPTYAEATYLHEADAMERAEPMGNLGLESPTEQTKGAMLNKLLVDARSDIITGRKPVSSWAETLKSWRSKGGDQVRSELTAAAAKR